MANRKILIAVDGSPYSLNAVKYAADLCSRSPMQISLLHVLPMASEELLWHVDMDAEFKSHIREKYDRFNSDCKHAGEKFLEQAKGVFASSGFSPECTLTLLQQWQTGIARDILAEARKGYDAVVVGRRGLGRIETLLMGSVCTKVVHGIDSIPVWIIGGEINSRKMLIAVDASENSRKAVISASGYAADAESEVTLFHSVRKFFPGIDHGLSSSAEEIEKELGEHLRGKIDLMFDIYKRRLEIGGVKPERISTRCNFHSYSRAADILDTAREGGYGTIVMGRRGISAVREFLMGRVTAKVLNGAEGIAVWIVP